MIWLLDQLDKHGEAIAYDCIQSGLRLRDLGTEDFSWGDLRVLITQAPRSSAFYRSVNPETEIWGQTEQLLAAAIDELRVANWQRGAGKKQDFPEPIARPGVEKKTVGNAAMTTDEMADFLGGAFANR